MARRPKLTEEDKKTQRLSALRLAHEAACRQAGTWGEMMVGEITHEATRSVYVQVWKGRHRPDPVEMPTARVAGVPAQEWLGVVAWVSAHRATGFKHRIVAWNTSADEARRIAEARVTELSAAGYAVVNPPRCVDAARLKKVPG